MKNRPFLDLSASPEAKVALDMLRAQAARGPYVTAANLGQRPLRGGADVVRDAPLSAGGRAVYGRAIDAWLAAGGAQPFAAPLRLAPLDEARIHDGMAELCRQRRLGAEEARAAGGGHPLEGTAGALAAAFARSQSSAPRPLSAARPGRGPARPPARAAAGDLAAGLSKARLRARGALAAARAAAPGDGLCALAEGRPRGPERLARGAGPAVPARLDRLAQALARLRDDHAAALRPSGAGLAALLAATGRLARPARLARAASELRRSRRAATPQGRLDLCLLAQADATLAVGGL